MKNIITFFLTVLLLSCATLPKSAENGKISIDSGLVNAIQTVEIEQAREVEEIVDLGNNLALGKRTRDNGHIYAFISDNVTDGSTSTYWEGTQDSYPNELIVDLGSDTEITAVRIKLKEVRLWASRIQNIKVLASSDNEDYTEIVAAEDYQFDPMINANTITIYCESTSRYVKLSFSSNSEANAGQVAEFEIY